SGQHPRHLLPPHRAAAEHDHHTGWPSGPGDALCARPPSPPYPFTPRPLTPPAEHHTATARGTRPAREPGTPHHVRRPPAAGPPPQGHERRAGRVDRRTHLPDAVVVHHHDVAPQLPHQVG